ncbi:MAG: LamB/YcsF family protein [Dehalococcoidia bacterium]|nr:LamB/YcsF family protein [Dehalococcoidia bacterium]
MDFNCDLGESYGSYKLGFDEQLMPYITSANIACGFHAGDPMWMQRTVGLAEEAGVAIGAHPGLPDLIGFGRREMKVTPEEAKNYVKYQIGALQAFTGSKRLQHVKPHGALYNMGVASKAIARAIAEAVVEVDDGMILVGLSGSVWIEAGEEVGLKVAREIFADRALNPDGTLVSRSQPGSVIEDPEQVIAASLKMVLEQKATAIDGREIPVKADTICLHGDTPGAVELARKLRERMEAAGIQVIPISQFI